MSFVKDPEDWVTESSEYVLKEKWFSVRRDRVRLPSGHTLDGYVVLESPPWVTIVAITQEDELVLIRQYRHGLGRVDLELPGGFVDDEDPVAAAQRELLEETGYGDGEWRVLQAVAPNPAIMNNWNYWVLAEGVRPVRAAIPDDGEDLALDLRPSASIKELLTSGEIVHALHVGALLRYLSERPAAY